ncbi:MAG TPA: hypothetical protein EYP85_11350, partial [Armatimonadetes bacterium]|nr:hypothetical protein [Armatimonadota bacterium]
MYRNLLLTAVFWGGVGCITAQEVLFEDSFAAYPPGSAAEANWLVASGEWEVQAGGLHSASRSRAIISATASPLLEAQTLEVTLTVHRRVSAEGWAHAGLMLYHDGSNFWRLGLVEAPDLTTHRIELLENYRGRWQAQSEPGTQLPSRSGGEGTWDYGRPYRLRLVLTPRLLRGEVRDAATGEMRRWIEYDLSGDVPALRRGRLALQTEGLEVTFDNAQVTGERPRPPQRRPGPPRVAVLRDDLPGLSSERAEFVAATLRPAGFTVTFLTADQLADPAQFSAPQFDLLVLPECRVFPLPAKPNLLAYLEAGGALLALGGPAFQRFLWPAKGEWLPLSEAFSRLRPAHFLFADFAAEDLSRW